MRKRLKDRFHRNMLRPIAHMVFIRVILGVTAALLWNEFAGRNSAIPMRSFAFVFLGSLLLVMGWMAFLRFDGVHLPTFDKRLFEWKKHPKRIRGDMIDFVDEDVISFDDLEADEKDLCRLIADVVCGGVFLLLSLL